MSYKIRSRHVIITNARDFFTCCRDEYETVPNEGQCQHYRVKFQYLNPSDIRRHQDCDLDSAVEGTRSFFSVRNTPHPLKLKVKKVPCLCNSCLMDNGNYCENMQYSDPWREVELKPKKGENKKKHMKRKHPKECISSHQVDTNPKTEEENERLNISDDQLPEIIVDNAEEENCEMMESVVEKECEIIEEQGNIFIDLTEDRKKTENACSDDCTFQPIENDDIIIGSENDFEYANELELEENGNLLEDKIYWESILGGLECCKTDRKLLDYATNISASMRPLADRKNDINFKAETYHMDSIANSCILSDAPKNCVPIWTVGDGNCMYRSLSKSYTGDDSMHLEIRARTVIDGIINKELYVTEEGLTRGANFKRNEETDESLPVAYVKYSDHYVNGQRITENTIDYIYSKELHDSAKINSYAGLWQLAQAASALRTPIQSVYPEGCDPLMRLDFNRIFYPLNCEIEVQPIVIMWTPVQKGCTPNHFVPLLYRKPKYAVVYLFRNSCYHYYHFHRVTFN